MDGKASWEDVHEAFDAITLEFSAIGDDLWFTRADGVRCAPSRAYITHIEGAGELEISVEVGADARDAARRLMQAAKDPFADPSHTCSLGPVRSGRRARLWAEAAALALESL